MSIWPYTKINPVDAVNCCPVGVTFAAAVTETPLSPKPDATWNPVKFITLCYSIFLMSLLIVGIYLKLNNFFYLVFALIILQMTFFQIKRIDINNSNKCLEIFKSNNFLGFIILISLLVGKI